MKRIFSALFAISICFSFTAQNTNDIWRTFETFSIPLIEKVNIPLRKMPVELIRAFCEGNIKAYYPQDTSKECSYHEFVAHFKMGACQPSESKSADEFNGVPCPESFCSSNDEGMLGNFLLKMELMQVKRFDKNKSMEIHDIKYVKLKYVYMKHGMEVELDGPVFKYKDIEKLAASFPDKYKVQNPKNTAENFTMKKVLESRMFNGAVVQPKHAPKKYPEHKNNNTEHDQWKH